MPHLALPAALGGVSSGCDKEKAEKNLFGSCIGCYCLHPGSRKSIRTARSMGCCRCIRSQSHAVKVLLEVIASPVFFISPISIPPFVGRLSPPSIFVYRYIYSAASFIVCSIVSPFLITKIPPACPPIARPRHLGTSSSVDCYRLDQTFSQAFFASALELRSTPGAFEFDL